MEKVVIRRILISEELNNQERFNVATKSLVSTTKQEMGGKFKIVFGIFAALSIMGILSLVIKITQGFDDKSSWGYYSAIVSLLFGVFGTAPMVAIAPMIAKADWQRPIARIANMFTAAGLTSVLMVFP